MEKISRQRLMERASLNAFRLAFMVSLLRGCPMSVAYYDRLLREMADEIDELENVLEQLQADETLQ